MFKSYWTSAWRMLVRNRVYTLINVLGLALGICACLVIWVIVRYEFSFDGDHPDGRRIYRISSYQQIMKDEPERLVPAVLADIPDAVRKEIPGVQLVAPFHILRDDTAMVTAVKKPAFYPAKSIVAGPEYLQLMGYTWLAGDPQTALTHPFSVVLTESRARQYFGPESLSEIIGREIVYQDSLRVNVSGIVRDWPENTDFPYTDFISFSTIDHSFLLDVLGLSPGAKYEPTVSALVKLAANADPAKVGGALSAIYHSHQDDQGIFPHVVLQPLREVHFTRAGNAHDQTAQLSILYALMSIAAFILLLAIINYVNLATAQALTREKEIGIRKVMGSDRGHLILQLLTETLVLTAVAGLFAVLAVRPVLNVFREFVPADIHFMPFTPDSLLFLAGISILVTLLAGLYPARMLSAHSAVMSLKGSGAARGEGKWWLRKGLIVFQFTVSLLFIIGTIAIGRQIGFMLHTDLGFKSAAIILFNTGERKDSVNKVKVLGEEIRQLPGVTEISRGNMPPAGTDRGIATIRYLARSNEPIRVEMIQADEHYIPLYEIKLLAGRNLFPSDTLREVVINENMSRTLGFKRPQDAIGQKLYTWNRYVPIVGVVADFHKYSYKEPIRPLMIAGMASTDLAVRLDAKGRSARELHAIVKRVERQWKTVYPHRPFEYEFFDEEIAQFYRQEQTMEWLLNIATGITLLISCIGLFGLTLFTTGRRTREIGIRKVMGADVKDILILLGKDFVRLVLIALVIASAGGWYLTRRWLQNYAYQVSLGVDVFLLAGAALLVLTVLTVGLQSLKAATANPVDSLRILTIILLCLSTTQLQAQPKNLTGATWSSGTTAYGCKQLTDSLIQFYDESKEANNSKAHVINVQVEPDGGLTVTDKGSMGFDPNIAKPGDTIVYREANSSHRYLIFYHKGRIWEAWEALQKDESLDHFDTRYRTLYGLAGTYRDSATHREIEFHADATTVNGLAAGSRYHFGYSYGLMQPLIIFDNGRALYYEPTPDDGLDIIGVKSFAERDGSSYWERGQKLMTLQKIDWVNNSGDPDLPGRYTFASTRLLIWAILINFSRDQLRLIRNEIFARYGYRFRSPDLIAYFSAQPWYTPRYDDVTNRLTDLERINIELLNAR